MPLSVVNEKQYDYIKGPHILPYLIPVFYIMRSILLLTNKFMDRRQVGFSACRNILCSDFSKTFNNQLRYVRIGFLSSAGLLMAYTVIYLIEAKDCIDETVTQHQTGSGDLGSIANETIVTLDNLNEIGFVGLENPYDD